MAEVRIISHMNKDHKLAIEDYLAVYGGVRIDSKITNIKLSQIDLNHLTITFKHSDIEFEIERPIAFEPPLNDLSEARIKLTEMAKFAAEKRGYAHFQVADYKYPGLKGWLLILLIHLPLISWIFPVVLLNKYVSSALSSNQIVWLANNNLNVFYLTEFIHLVEVIFILRPKLAKYRVPTDYSLEWYIAGLVEGFPSFRRLNKVIEEKQH